MSRGIRQGCPISAILYLFVAEILALSITQNVNIHGIKPHNSELELKSVQHADDLTVILKDILSLNETLETINKFCEHAGSKININKTECILLGSLKNMYNEVCNIKVNTNVVKCLGIFMGHNKIECYRKNWIDKSEE